jgi:hypothetical protein
LVGEEDICVIIHGCWGATEQLFNAFHNCSVAPKTPTLKYFTVKKDINPVLALFLILGISLALTFIHFNRVLDHLSEVSLFDHSAPWLLFILFTSLAFTFIHTLQEWKGRGAPLWRNFGAVVGVCVPDWLGFLFFFLTLTAVLWLVAIVAITGNLLTYAVQTKYTVGALGALIGARLGDTLVSHVLLYVLRYRPNPGLLSTPLYFLEAVFFILTFSKGLTAFGGFSCVGFIVGAGFFCIVLPLLRLLGIVIPSWRRDPWRRGERPPEWARLKD